MASRYEAIDYLIMSLNPINEIGESPRSTINSLSTSTTSSASSFSHHLRAPISTSLPSYSSSASTYVGPNSERTTTETGTSNTPTSTDGVWNNLPQQQNQNQNLPLFPQIYRTTRAISFSSRNTSSSASSLSSSMTSNNNVLSSLSPQMERSHSTSTVYSFSSSAFHEKSLSGGSISVKENNSVISIPYTSNNKMNLVYDASVTSKELERMEQSGQQHDTWGSLVVKVLPLFNGEGLKLYIEDLNDLVRRCINDRPIKLLYEDINELLESGMFTLNGKLRGVPDEKLVSRLVELWSFYFGTVIPYFEGVFLPLQIHSTTQQNNLSIRRLVLMSFRDHVILPMGNRVEDAFNKLFHDFDSGIPVTDTATRMLQMSYILSSVLSDDDKQKDMDRILGKLKNNWKLFMRRRDRRGFVGISPSNSNSSNSNNTSSSKSTPQDSVLNVTTDNLVVNSTKISNPTSGFSSAASI